SYLRCTCSVTPQHLPSFPTRRSSDLWSLIPSCRCCCSVRPGSVRSCLPAGCIAIHGAATSPWCWSTARHCPNRWPRASCSATSRSEEHTSELQSRENLVCRLLLEKKK